MKNKKIFEHPQETWDEKKCAAIARKKGRDGHGTKELRAGRIAGSASNARRKSLQARRKCSLRAATTPSPSHTSGRSGCRCRAVR